MSKDDVSALAVRMYAEEKTLAGLFQRLRPRICPFAELIAKIPENARVLDIGGGSGLFAGLLCSTFPGVHVYSFDSSEKAVRIAERMKSRLPDEIAERLIIEHRSIAQGLPEGMFDVVSMIDVLHHIPPRHQKDAVLQACSHVRDDGFFLYKDMGKKPAWCALMNRLHDMATVREWIHYRSIEDVAAWSREAGLLEVETGSRRLFWYMHEWKIFQRTSF